MAVESVRHKDKRKNIPTEELRDFVAEDEAKPKTIQVESKKDGQIVGRASYVVSRDGKEFLLLSPLGKERMQPITVVLNWAAALRAS